MATRALAAQGGIPELVEDDETYVSSAQTEPTYAVLPPIDDGSSTSVAVGTEIRFEATAGSPIFIMTDDERLVGTCPGYGACVVVAEQGADESETDFWRFQVLANAPAAAVAGAAGTDSAIIDAIAAALVDFGILKAE